MKGLSHPVAWMHEDSSTDAAGGEWGRCPRGELRLHEGTGCSPGHERGPRGRPLRKSGNNSQQNQLGCKRQRFLRKIWPRF